MKYLNFFLIKNLIILIFFNTIGYSLNECGGDRPLLNKLGEICDTHNPSACPFGRIECNDKNTQLCIPDCAITTQYIFDLTKNQLLNNTRCFNEGFFDTSLRKCRCTSLYTGMYCEVANPCVYIHCGKYGHCEDGKCLCDFMFFGESCEHRRDCRPPNFLWADDQCKCQQNYEGKACDVCTEGLLCVPDKDSVMTFSPVIIKDKSLLHDLLNMETPPGYLQKPFVPLPNNKQQCQCGFISQDNVDRDLTALTILSPQFAQVSRPPSSSLSRSRQFSEHSDYIHHFYTHHYLKKEECHVSNIFLFLLFVGLLSCVFIVIVYLFVVKPFIVVQAKKGAIQYRRSEDSGDGHSIVFN